MQTKLCRNIFLKLFVIIPANYLFKSDNLEILVTLTGKTFFEGVWCFAVKIGAEVWF